MAKPKRNYQKNPIKLDHITAEDKTVLDPWQEEVLEVKGNVALRAGRQVGKSTIISKKARDFALTHPKTNVLVIAATQRQSSYIFEKIRGELESLSVNVFAEKPTQTKIILKNGSKIYSFPTGRTGYLIRGLTIDLLIADEAAFIPELVWLSVIPMIAVSQKARGFGWVWLLSTPLGDSGFFYESFKNPTYKTWHINSEDCERIPKDLLKMERARLSRQEYMQEWQGEFISEISKFFPTETIQECLREKMDLTINKNSKYFLGVDVARYGGDENAFVVAELTYSGKMRIVHASTTERKALTHTRDQVKILEDKYKFNRIFIDDGGVGGGLTDMLKEIFKKKIIAINNASRSVTETRSRAILKQDIYSNALVLMEQEKLEMIDDFPLKLSLDGIKYRYSDENKLRIYGKNSHLAEAYVRALWGFKEKGLKLFVHTF